MPTRPIHLAYSALVEDTGRRLDPIAVEAALNRHRPHRDLPAPEAAEALRILRRRGYRLHYAAFWLDVDPREIAVAYIAISGMR